jgi:hypothetical protein
MWPCGKLPPHTAALAVSGRQLDDDDSHSTEGNVYDDAIALFLNIDN